MTLSVCGSPSSPDDEKEKQAEKPDTKELDPNKAQDRSLNVGPKDQLAVESVGGYHSVVAPYPGPIPVPLPLPVQPGSIVLPDLPRGSTKGSGGGGGGGPGYGKTAREGGGHGSGHGAKIPPPAVHKQSHPPLTRSSNPSPVSHFSKQDRDTTNYHPPPPPPQLPQQEYAPPPPNYVPPPPAGDYNPPSNYAPPPPPPAPRVSEFSPPSNYAPPPSNDYSPPSNDLHSDSYTPPQAPPGDYQGPSQPSPEYRGPSQPSGDYGQPKQADLYEGQPSVQGHGNSFVHGQPSVAQLHEIPVNNYQAPVQHSVSQPAFKESSAGLLGSAYVPPTSLVPDDPWLSSGSDMPQISDINVKCEKNLMRITIVFDRPFYGIIFSKGHYSNVHCVHLPAGLGRTSSTFDISINSCGTSGNADNGLYGYGSESGSGTYFENTLVIQYDPQVQEVWDQARKLRCTWHDQYEKSVTFKPFPVDMLDVVRADFAGDNVGCWMQIQVGKGPWASEVSGLVKIGQAMTMVLAIKDEDNKFDMLVRNCMAHDGKRAPIQLVDQRGCVTRPKLMSKFTKIKNFGASASVLSYAHFQAFKFPDSMEVHFQCTIQICRYQCPEQCAESTGYQQPGTAYDVPRAVGQPRDSHHRRKRDTNETLPDGETDIGVNRIIQVVSTRDLSFLLDKKEILREIKETDKETLVSSVTDDSLGLICMSTPGFAATLVVLLSILVISCLLSAFLCLRFRGNADTQSIISSYQNPAFLHKRRFF